MTVEPIKGMTPERAAALRRPFPPESVGKLPKPYKKDSPKGNCGDCGGYHGLPAAHLDYCGHAAVTDRLLTVDPEWSWEPMAFDQYGSPQCDREGNLWIRLTVCGITRLGVGDGSNMKERIGDAIRNAAMRFGVALDLWAKENLVEFAQAASGVGGKDPTPPPVEVARDPVKERKAERVKAAHADDPFYDTPPRGAGDRQISTEQLKKLGAQMRELHITDRDAALLYVQDVIGREVSSRNDLTRSEASKVIDALAQDAEQVKA